MCVCVYVWCRGSNEFIIRQESETVNAIVASNAIITAHLYTHAYFYINKQTLMYNFVQYQYYYKIHTSI